MIINVMSVGENLLIGYQHKHLICFQPTRTAVAIFFVDEGIDNLTNKALIKKNYKDFIDNKNFKKRSEKRGIKMRLFI